MTADGASASHLADAGQAPISTQTQDRPPSQIPVAGNWAPDTVRDFSFRHLMYLIVFVSVLAGIGLTAHAMHPAAELQQLLAYLALLFSTAMVFAPAWLVARGARSTDRRRAGPPDYDPVHLKVMLTIVMVGAFTGLSILLLPSHRIPSQLKPSRDGWRSTVAVVLELGASWAVALLLLSAAAATIEWIINRGWRRSAVTRGPLPRLRYALQIVSALEVSLEPDHRSGERTEQRGGLPARAEHAAACLYETAKDFPACWLGLSAPTGAEARQQTRDHAHRVAAHLRMLARELTAPSPTKKSRATQLAAVRTQLEGYVAALDRGDSPQPPIGVKVPGPTLPERLRGAVGSIKARALATVWVATAGVHVAHCFNLPKELQTFVDVTATGLLWFSLAASLGLALRGAAPLLNDVRWLVNFGRSVQRLFARSVNDGPTEPSASLEPDVAEDSQVAAPTDRGEASS